MKAFVYLPTSMILVLFILFSITSCTDQDEKEKAADKDAKNKIERVEPEQDTPITDVVKVGILIVRQRITELFPDSHKQNKQSYLDRFIVFTKEHDVFPSDFQMQHFASNNKQLAQYLGTPTARKENDLYLFDALGEFWESPEYLCKGQPAKFRTNFIVHLELTKGGETLIEIIQYQPNVWCGNEFYIGRHGPGSYDNIKWVSPTIKESRELLQFIVNKVKDKF